MQCYQKQLAEIVERDNLWKCLSGSTILLSGATGMLGKCLVDAVMLYNQHAASSFEAAFPASFDTPRLILLCML